MAATAPTTPGIAERVARLVGLDAIMTEKMSAELEAHKSLQAKVAAAIPEVVETLLQYKRIEPHEKQAAAAALADPLKALQYLKVVAAHANDEEALQLGKQAGAVHTPSSVDSAFPGRRSTGPRESDAAFARGLGVGV